MKALLLSTVGLTMLLPITPAAAQVEEIIVTARKREESLLKAPVIEQAITKESLEKFGTADLYSVATRVPGILIGAGIGAIGQQISIRGIGTTAQNPTIDQSVSLNIDGLQLNQSLAYSAGLFDVGQVEVLKGPQALFFGKNSPAGVISLRSADPTNKFEVTARGGYEFEAKERFADLIVSGPVSDSLRLRLAARYSDMDGFFINDASAFPNLGSRTPAFRNLAPTKSAIVRGTAIFNPDDRYSARLKLNYTKEVTNGGGFSGQLTYCPDGTGGVAPRNIAFLAGDNCKIDRHVRLAWMDPSGFPGITHGGKPFFDTRQKFGTLEQNLNLVDELKLTSVTSFYDLHTNFLIQGTTSGNVVSLALNNQFDNRQYTQEVRLGSDFNDSPVDFTVGAFYQNAKQQHSVNLLTNTTLGLAPVLQSVLHTIDIQSFSGFGQLIWTVVPHVELAGGARWTHETRNHVEINRAAASGALGKLNLIDPRIASNNLSPELTVTYTPTDDMTLFGSYKQGFKSGSFNTVQFVPATTRASFGDEKVRGFEGGIKARLLDRHLRLNLAGYRYNYNGLQVGSNERNPDGTIALRTLNAAGARVYGIDFDAVYSPAGLEGLTLNTAINWNRAHFGAFTNAPCEGGQTISEGCNLLLNAATGRFSAQDLSGTPLIRAPQWMGVVGADYELPVGNDWTFAFGSTATYTSRYLTALVKNPNFYQASYWKVNANIALRGRDNEWEVALIGNNLTNKIVAAQCSNANPQNGSILGGGISGGPAKGPAGDDEGTCIAERGRYLGLRLTLRPFN